MKNKHPALYAFIRRLFLLILIAMVGLTIASQYLGWKVSPEPLMNRVMTTAQSIVSAAGQGFSDYLYRLKLRSNIEYEYNQLKAQNDELTLKSLLYDEVVEENSQLRALLGEY